MCVFVCMKMNNVCVCEYYCTCVRPYVCMSVCVCVCVYECHCICSVTVCVPLFVYVTVCVCVLYLSIVCDLLLVLFIAVPSTERLAIPTGKREGEEKGDRGEGERARR